MDVLGAVGTAAGVAALIVGGWQLRVALLERRDRVGRQGRQPAEPAVRTITPGALPVSAPLGRLPIDVLGRDELLKELGSVLQRRTRQERPGTFVLAGMGGVGKSTVALQLAAEAKRKNRHVWWVSAADPSSLQGGMLEVLHQLGAPGELIAEVRDGAQTAADRFWTFLQARPARGSLLIFDNADQPAVLSKDGVSSPADGTGWVRPDAAVLTVVTTRTADPQAWGNGVQLRPLEVLTDQQGAQVLRKLAPQSPDPDRAEALARRLGALPLALHLAGTYLSSPLARWKGFEEYRKALDSDKRHQAVGDLDLGGDNARRTISSSWELSLDALAEGGLPDARRLLYLLACFAPSIPVAPSMLRWEAERNDGRHLVVLKGLAMAALVQLEPADGHPAVTVHPIIADTCRMRLVAGGNKSAGILTAAVELLVAAAAGLQGERSSDRACWQVLLPHLTALLEWAAPYLDEDAAASLLQVGRDAFGSLWLESESSGPRAEEMARLSLIVAERLPPDHPQALGSRYMAGCALAINGRHAEAETAFNDLLVDLRRVLGNAAPETLLARDQLAGAVLALGRYQEAERLYRELVADQERYLGAEHSDTLTTTVDLAWTLGKQEQYEEAAAICRRVLAVDLRIHGQDHPRTLDAWGDLVRWTTAAGEPAEAERLGNELVEIERRVLGAHHPATLFHRAAVAAALAVQDRLTEAEQIFVEVLASLDRNPGPGDYRTVIVREDFAAAQRLRVVE